MFLGIYFYVIFFNCVVGVVCIGFGILLIVIGNVYGVIKVYIIRVGFGGFLIEFKDVSCLFFV